jgi:hypothetical protein
MFLLLTQSPIVVDLAKTPEAERDISVDIVLGMFATAGWFLLAGAIGCGIVAGGVVLYKRWRDSLPAETEQAPHTHTTLHIGSSRG